MLDDRTKLVAKKVTEFLKESGDRFQKTIVFCVDQEHAARMRQALVNENADLVAENHRYVMRITGNDTEGQDQLGNFIDPESKYPVLVTTSRLLSTGVDAQTCRLIVLDREVGSMTEFKQIVGRGTRVHEDTKKFYFTLIDFRGATSHFADPDFDGEPVQIYEPGAGRPDRAARRRAAAGDDGEPLPPTPGDGRDHRRWTRRAMGRPPTAARRIARSTSTASACTIIAERVEYLDENGKLVTESLRDFTKKALKKRFASLDDFLKRWKAAERKQAIIEELAAEGLPLDPLAEEVGKDLDPFDLICHVAFDQPAADPPRARRERPEARRVHEVRPAGPRRARRAARRSMQDEGVLNLDDANVSCRSRRSPRWARRSNSSRRSATRDGFEQAVHELQSALYQETA